MEKRLISIRLEEPLVKEYQKKARQRGITFTDFVKNSLKDYNERIDKEQKDLISKNPTIREYFESLYQFIIDYAAIYILLFLLNTTTIFLKQKFLSNQKIKIIINGFLDNSINWLQGKLKTELHQKIVENQTNIKSETRTKEIFRPRDSNEVIVATQDFSESRFLGALTSVFIEARIPKLDVKTLYNNGGAYKNTWEIFSGDLDVCCTYTGQVLEHFRIDYIESNTNSVISKINDYLLPNMGLYNNSSRPSKLVCPFGFRNDWRIVVKKDFAKRNNFTTISDLRHCKALRIAVEEDFAKQPYGLDLLYGHNDYNLDIKRVFITKHEEVYDYLDRGKVELIDGFQTDIHLNTSSDYRVLKDDKSLFKSYDAGLLLSGRLLSNHGYLEEELSDLEGKLNNQEISQIIHQIDSTFHSNDFDYIEKIAYEWLVEQKLI